MTAPSIRVASAGDEARALSVLTLAFSADPAARFTWPDAERYLKHFGGLARAFGGRAFEHGTAYVTDDGAATALWLPPNVEPDEKAANAVMRDTVPAELHKDMGSVFEQMARYHPKEPHWFLPLIGVDPSRQGKGHGSALMKHVLAVVDRDRLPAYLESSNPKNIPLYERHGFEVIGSIQSGESPRIVPMLRKPGGSR